MFTMFMQCVHRQGLSRNVFTFQYTEISKVLSTIGKATADYDALASRGLKLDRTACALRLVTPLALGSRLLGVASTGPLPLLCPPGPRSP